MDDSELTNEPLNNIYMKKFLLILLLLPALCRGQVDSAKVTVNNVVIKAKDMWYVLVNLPKTNRNEVLDSTIRARSRANNLGNNDDVTINGIERRVWREVYQTLYVQPHAHMGNVVKRVHDAILLINDVWLNDKVPKDEVSMNTVYDSQVDVGKKIAKKEND